MTFLSLENDPEYIGLQTELIALQRWIIDHRKRLLIIFEGRDTASKGGAIMRFVLNKIDYTNKGKTGQRLDPDPGVVEVPTD